MARPLSPRVSRHPLSAIATLLATLPSSSPLWHPPPSTTLLWASSWPVRRLSAASFADEFIAVAQGVRRVGFLSVWPNYRSRVVHSHSRKLLAIMHQRSWDAAVEDDLANSGIPLRPNIVDQVITCIPSPKLALQFFIWAGEQIGYPPLTSTTTYDIVQWYGHKSQLFRFLSVLKGLEDRCFGLSPSRVNVLLQGYGWAGMLDRSFGVMIRTQGFSNDVLVKCLLYSIMRQFRYDMVYDVYMEMKKQGTRFDLCCNELIQGMALAEDERWHDADLLFKQIADSGHFLDEKTWNALIWGISRAGQHERAYTLLEDMMKKKIKLTSETLVAVTESLCHAKELHRASRVIEEMKKQGFKVGSKVYNSFLKALGGQGGPEK
ncbi:hypothetical protein GOP47_0004695 [Adiantum capillus-veneris]|uniref:Pentatricopeptide repeat-containing protein n=1 Tax=Adiantum capillus-veneris TaxID=13818 RepID=A0A9D4V8J1_ADICA|nr:hypothetical protein GOP47_0004695 [Adiantum capillus-veneris]